MRILLISILFSLFSFTVRAQEKYKDVAKKIKDDEKIADTTNFPDPFEFRFIDTSGLSKSALYTKCLQWLVTVAGNVKPNLEIADSVAGKIMVVKVEAGYNVGNNMTIDVKDNKYRLTIDHFLYHLMGYVDTYVAYPRPNLKGVAFRNQNLEMYYIEKRNDALFKSLQDAVKKNDNF